MAPHQHLQWFEDNIGWFESLTAEDLERDVPNCPGWTVENVVNHLSFGVGLAYPEAVTKPPDTRDEHVFAGVRRPDVSPVGPRALEIFSQNMRSCLAAFNNTDPEQPTWTYAGPGVAKFWFRRAAIETTLHQIDVSEALARRQIALAADRTIDAISETVEFALPLAARIAGEPDGRLTVATSDQSLLLNVGTGDKEATMTGASEAVLAALWGRHQERVEVVGDRAVATEWLSRIEHAFAGR